jgi:hypothetical protein
VVRCLADAGRLVCCVICTLNMPAVVDVARAHGLPWAIYWIQPATVLVTYYHYFHGHSEDVTSHAVDPTYETALLGLRRPHRIRDMLSFIVDDATDGGKEISKMVLQGFRQLFEQMDEEGMMVLVNTFEALEAMALEAIRPYLDASVFAVGAPAVPLPGAGEEGRKGVLLSIH